MTAAASIAAVDVPHHHDPAGLGIQGLEGLLDGVLQVLGHGASDGILLPPGGLGIGGPFRVQAEGAAPAGGGALLAGGEVAGDGIEPGVELALPPEVPDPEIAFQEDLLGQILGGAGVPQEMGQGVDEAVLVFDDQALERLGIPLFAAGDQFQILGQDGQGPTP